MNQTELLYLSMEDVKKVGLSFSDCIEIVEQTVIEEAKGAVELPERQQLRPSPKSFTSAMSARVPALNGFGMKYLAYRPGNSSELGLPDSGVLLTINDPVSMHPLCVMEGYWLTCLRTASMTAVIAKHFAKESPETVTFIGVGNLPRWVLPALETVFPTIKQAKGYKQAKNSEGLRVAPLDTSYIESFRKDMEERARSEIIGVKSVQEAMEGADIIISATPRVEKPFLLEKYWEPGSIAIPLDGPSCWERKIFEEADKVFVDGKDIFEAIEKSYPGINYKGETGLVSEVVSGAKKSRDSTESRNMILSHGIGIIDVTVGRRIYELAKQKGIGSTLKFMSKDVILPPKII